MYQQVNLTRKLHYDFKMFEEIWVMLLNISFTKEEQTLLV